MRSTPALVALVAALAITGCGFAERSPSATPSQPSAPSSSPSSEPVLADTVGDSPFYLDDVSVRVAESFPVQLFLAVTGLAPSPCHAVAYLVRTEPDRIDVTITSQPGTRPCAQVLDPRELSLPLGPATLPVTVDVNGGEFVEIVQP
jgi:hypothetical protein